MKRIENGETADSSFCKSGEHIYSWDTLRFFFILGITIYHTGTYFEYFGSKVLGPVYSMGGYFGNYFFFLLSGMVIAMTYKERIFSGEESFFHFLVRRLRKVYPVYVLGEVLAIGFLVVVSGWAAISVRHLICDGLLITSGWFFDWTPFDLSAWFLCVIFLCYILYFLISRISRGSRGIYLLLLFAMVVLGAVLIQRDLGIPFLYRINGEGYMNFFLGCLLFEGYHYIKKTDKKIWIGMSAALLTVLIAVACLKNSFLMNYKIFISVICILIILLTERVTLFRRALGIKPLVILGGISMELFLLQAPVLNIYCNVCSALNTKSINTGILYMLFFIILFAVSFAVKYTWDVMKNRRLKNAAQ